MTTEAVAAKTPRWTVAPYFRVKDVVTTANFYRDKMGFRYERFWGDPPCFTMIHRSGVTIMLGQDIEAGFLRPNRAASPEDVVWDAYVWVDNADALYEEFQANGVTIARAIGDQPYECRDFDIEDCNGFRLCFGHGI